MFICAIAITLYVYNWALLTKERTARKNGISQWLLTLFLLYLLSSVLGSSHAKETSTPVFSVSTALLCFLP